MLGRGRGVGRYGEDGDCDCGDDEALAGPEFEECGLGAGGHPGVCGWRREGGGFMVAWTLYLSRLAPRNFGAPKVRVRYPAFAKGAKLFVGARSSLVSRYRGWEVR